MRQRHLFAATALAALLAAPLAFAEPLGRHFELTPFAGWTMFDGKISNVTGQPLTDDLYMGGRLGYAFSPLWGLEVAAGFTPTTEDIPGGQNVDIFHASGNLMLTPFANRYGGPFVFVGGGTAQVKPSSGPRVDQGDLEVGGGVRFWLSDAVGVRFEARDLAFNADSPSGKTKLNSLVLGGGLTFAIGATPRDTDADGVPDKKDKCPDTPKGAKVDASGCPLDTDGDKVFDGLDQCPDTPKGATVDTKGCPHDADADGVFDGLDQCSDTPKGAKVDVKGCPRDTDGDGVFDGIDQCPNTPAGAKVDASGCPVDSDGDGVFDGLDKCPDTPKGLQIDATGCPVEMIERETELLDTGMIRLNNVNFETGKDSILAGSYGTLDAVGALLAKWPQLQIEIGGHTDNTGSASKNAKLSKARAQAVENYILGHHSELQAGQYTVKGYGSTKPIATNKTPEGKAQNRRVEFKVLNKDVLKNEVEKRRLAPADGAPADSTKK